MLWRWGNLGFGGKVVTLLEFPGVLSLRTALVILEAPFSAD